MQPLILPLQAAFDQRLTNGAGQPLQGEGLGHKAAEPQFQGFDGRTQRPKAGDNHPHEIGLEFKQPPIGVQSIQVRHIYVNQGQVESLGPSQIKGRMTIVCQLQIVSLTA